jgi:nitrite reductase/ring-hydroxylating ferredoxin subunit
MAVVLCKVSDIPRQNGLEAHLPDAGAGRDIMLFRSAKGVVAYHNVCPHQGRSLSIGPGEFLLGKNRQLICPHHGASFDLGSGECVSGPCKGDRLKPLPLRLEGDLVYIDRNS